MTLPLPSSETIPTCLAMLEAVILLSPVTMITLIPAVLQFAIADFDYSLGGSSIPNTPISVNPLFSISSITSFTPFEFLAWLCPTRSLWFTFLYPIETVLSPLPAIFYSYFVMLCLSYLVSGTTCPVWLFWNELHTSKICSLAPLVNKISSLPTVSPVDILFRVESNGNLLK